PELTALVGRVATFDPAAVGTLYVRGCFRCGRPLPEVAVAPPPEGEAMSTWAQERPCACPEPRAVRMFDWPRSRALGVSRLVKHVALDRSGNDTAEWHDPMAARQLLAKVYGLTSDANVQVNVAQLGSMSIEELKAIVSG